MAVGGGITTLLIRLELPSCSSAEEAEPFNPRLVDRYLGTEPFDWLDLPPSIGDDFNSVVGGDDESDAIGLLLVGGKFVREDRGSGSGGGGRLLSIVGENG